MEFHHHHLKYCLGNGGYFAKNHPKDLKSTLKPVKRFQNPVQKVKLLGRKLRHQPQKLRQKVLHLHHLHNNLPHQDLNRMMALSSQD